MASKRKHYEVTLQTKYNALKDLEKVHLNKDVAKEYNIKPVNTSPPKFGRKKSNSYKLKLM